METDKITVDRKTVIDRLIQMVKNRPPEIFDDRETKVIEKCIKVLESGSFEKDIPEIVAVNVLFQCLDKMRLTRDPSLTEYGDLCDILHQFNQDVNRETFQLERRPIHLDR